MLLLMCGGGSDCHEQSIRLDVVILMWLPSADEEEDDDDTHDANADPWNLPQPLNEIFALWSDTADELKRLHDSSAHQ